MTIIQAFRREDQMKKEFAEMNDEHYEYNRKLLFLDSATSHNLVNVFRLIMFAIFIYYFGTQSMTVTDAGDGRDTICICGLYYAII